MDNARLPKEGYPSGQRGQTVNLLAYAFGGSNPPPSTKLKTGDRVPGASRQARAGKQGKVPDGSKAAGRYRHWKVAEAGVVQW